MWYSLHNIYYELCVFPDRGVGVSGAGSFQPHTKQKVVHAIPSQEEADKGSLNVHCHV